MGTGVTFVSFITLLLEVKKISIEDFDGSVTLVGWFINCVRLKVEIKFNSA